MSPFIKIGGQPLFLFNILERKFVLFGQAFWPQDFFLFGLAMITFFVFIILFTVVFGRLWCGWACPQTLFMEMVFRKIEYWIEGDANQQRKLDKAPWNSEKIRKKTIKHGIFLLISIVIAHTLMAYIVGVERVKELITQSPTNNMAGFLGLVAFTAVFYFVFARFREQACVTVCPYGRLQGVLLTKESIAITYDWLRGEPRGRLKKGTVQDDKGDCIDCKLCVHACPTGIDIRNGTQLECVNCTACIDACDDVMTKIKKPTGLIRYDSHQGVAEGKKLKLNARIIGYIVVLTLLLSFLGYLLTTRQDVEVTLLRVPGVLYQEQENDRISNLYNAQFINKTFEDVALELKLIDQPDGTIKKVGGDNLSIGASDKAEGVYFIEVPKSELTGRKTNIKIGLYKDGDLVDEFSTNFLGPITRKRNK